MKRVITLILALTMLLSLSACGGNASEPVETTKAPVVAEQNEAPVVAETEPAGEPKIFNDDTSISGTVRFWIPFKGNQGMDDLIAEFNATYPNIKVELTPYSNNSDGNMAVNTSLMAGEIDVLWSFELHNTFKRWENGLYMDLTDRLAEDNLDLVDNWGTDAYKYNDRIYTVPAGGRSFFVAINMTKWNAAGLGEIPTEWTWDEYLEACKAMTEVDADGNVAVYGGSSYQSINTVMNTMYQVYGKNAMYHEDGTSSFDDPVIHKALAREIQAENVDKIWFPLTTYRSDNLQAQTTYLGGQTASTLNTNLVRFLRDTETYPVDWITAFAPYPTEEAGQDNYMEGISPFSHIGVATNCDKDNLEASYAFMKFAATHGSKYLALAGHMPNWKGINVDDMVSLVFGSEEDAAKLVDVETYKNVVCNFEALSYIDTELTAYSEINSLMQEYVMYAHNGEMTAEEALSELTELADEAIKNG